MHGDRIDKKVDFILLLWFTRTSHWAPRNFYFFVKEKQFMTGKMKPFSNFSFGSNYQVGFSSAHFPENKLERVANWGSRTCLASPAKQQKELGQYLTEILTSS